MAGQQVEVFARKLKDLNVPIDIGADPNAFSQVKIATGNMPAGFSNFEGLYLVHIIQILSKASNKYFEPLQQAEFELRLKQLLSEFQKKADEVVAKGFYLGFANEAAMRSYTPSFAETRAKLDDTKKVYRWERTSAEGVIPITGIWHDTGLSELDQAKEYTDLSIIPIQQKLDSSLRVDTSSALEASEDSNGMIYRIIDKNGNTKYAGTLLELKNILLGSIESEYLFLNLDSNGMVTLIQKKDGDLVIPSDLIFNKNQSLKNMINQDQTGQQLWVLSDAEDKVILFQKKDGDLVIPSDLIFNSGKSLVRAINDAVDNISSEKLYRKIAPQTYQSSLVRKIPARFEFTSVITKADTPGLINRMPAAIKTPTGMFIVWHQRTKPEYDGDGSGSAFWSCFADVDENLNVTVRDKKLFIYPDTDAGIIKHPHLGRTNDGRLLLVYEKSVGYIEATPEKPVDYIKYKRYSSDNGVTWTNPEPIIFTNAKPVSQLMALGTTCNIINLDGRLIVALYSAGGWYGCMYSDNQGDTWTYSITPIQNINFGFEPAIAPDSDNNLVMTLRTTSDSRAPFVGFAKSADRGETWEYTHLDKVKGQTNQSHLLYDETIGAHILSHSLTVAEGWRRKHRLSISYDDCNTFPLSFAPFPDARFIGYSQILKYSDGYYFLIAEGNPTKNGGNQDEEIEIHLITLTEMLNNVTYS